METEYVLLTAQAPGRFRRYRIAILEVEKGYKPSRIDERLKGVVRIHKLWDRLNGDGKNTQFTRAYAEAKETLAELQQGEGINS